MLLKLEVQVEVQDPRTFLHDDLVKRKNEEQSKEEREGSEDNEEGEGEEGECADSNYAAICLELTDIKIKAILGGASDLIPEESITAHTVTSSRSLYVALDTSIYLYQSTAADESTSVSANTSPLPSLSPSSLPPTVLSSSLCASFPIRLNVSKSGANPVALTTSMSTAEFMSTLSVPSTSKAIALLSVFEEHRQGAVRILKGFNDTVRSTIPFVLSPNQSVQDPSFSPRGHSSAERISTLSSSSALTQLLDSASSSSSGVSGDNTLRQCVMTYGEPSTTLLKISSQINSSLYTTHQSIENLHLAFVKPSHLATSAIANALLVCRDLQDTALKLRHAALVTVGVTPVYCGWVYRSHGFMINPPRAAGRRRYVNGKESSGGSGWGVRSWAVFVKDNLLFMSQPYAGTVDYAVRLDDILVKDPDESDVTVLSNSSGPAEKVVRLSNYVTYFSALY